jgi:small-conductance mechanosensitive channel
MVVTTAFDGPSASLRPTGVMRYFAAIFLLVWLTGWLIGETLALGVLVMLIRSIVGTAIGASWTVPGGDWIVGGAAGFVLLFLLVWLTMWTVGGVAAIKELLRSLAGEDRVTIESLRLELQRRAGPFHRTHRFERSDIRRVRIRRHDAAVVIDTNAGTQTITTYGTADERRAVADWLRSRLLLPEAGTRFNAAAPPPGWRMSTDRGVTQLSKDDPRARAIAAGILWFIVLLLTLVVAGAEGGSSGRLVAAAITALVAGLAIWLTLSRRVWRVRHGDLTEHRRFLTWERHREFKSARLEVVTTTDSDSDEHHALYVIASNDRRKIASELHDATEVVEMGQWLAARTGFPLTLPHKLR